MYYLYKVRRKDVIYFINIYVHTVKQNLKLSQRVLSFKNLSTDLKNIFTDKYIFFKCIKNIKVFFIYLHDFFYLFNEGDIYLKDLTRTTLLTIN